MARPIWSGSLTFGLVNLAVRLYPATEDHTPHFHQFQRGTEDRIRYKRVNERTGDEVDYGDIVRGAPVGDGEYVVLETAELDDIAPGRSKSLEIDEFVRGEDIDPVFYRRTYYLAPSGEGADTPYRLLRDAMRRSGRVGVASFVMRSRQYLAALRPDGPVLTLTTMHFADEVRDPVDTVGDLPAAAGGRDRQREMAEQLIESMSGEWDPDRYHDTYTERVDQLVEDKRTGREVVAHEEPPGETNVVDLMEALRASVERGGGSGTDGDRHDDASSGRSSSGRRAAKGRSSGGRAKESRSSGGRSTGERGSPRGSSHRSRRRESAGRDDLSTMTRSQLAERARRLDVKGRSSMRRDELERAVRRAQRPSRRRAS